MKIKNFISLFLVLTLVVTVISGCGPKNKKHENLVVFTDPKTGEESTVLTDSKGNQLLSQQEIKDAFRVFVQIQRDYAYNFYQKNASALAANMGIKNFSELLSYKMDQRTYRESIKADAEKLLLQYITFKRQFTELGLKFSEEEKKDIDKSFKDIVKAINKTDTSAFSKICSELGITQETFKELIIVGSSRVGKVADYYFGEGGENEITKEDVQENFDKNYSRIKAIFLSCLDDNGKPLEDDKLKEKQDKAAELVDKANKGANFEDMIKEESEIYIDIKDAKTDNEKEYAEKFNKQLTETGFLYNEVGYDNYFYNYISYIPSIVMDEAEKLDIGKTTFVEIKNKNNEGKDVITGIWVFKAYDIHENEDLFKEVSELIKSNIEFPLLQDKVSEWETSLSYHFVDEAEATYLDFDNMKNLFDAYQSEVLQTIFMSNTF